MRIENFLARRLTTAAFILGWFAAGPICFGQSAADNSQPPSSQPAATATVRQKQNEREATASAKKGGADAALAIDDVNLTYEFTQPEFYVRRVLIQHDGRGRGQITFEKKNADQPLTEPIELSPAALARIAARWDALRYLEGDTKYQSSKQFAHLGTVRLKAQRAGGQERGAEFNWTDVKDAAQLAEEYRRVGDQAMFVFDIKLARELQPLEAPKIMGRLDTLISRNAVSDARQLLPLLEDLSTDERVPLIARNHAQRLIKKINKLKN